MSCHLCQNDGEILTRTRCMRHGKCVVITQLVPCPRCGWSNAGKLGGILAQELRKGIVKPAPEGEAAR